MTTQQSEVLRLAEEISDIHCHTENEARAIAAAADSLCSQHARIAELEARIKTMAEEHADELMVAHMDGRSKAAQQPGAAYAALPYKQALGSTNCMQCCVSYMMGLPLENVPDFATDGGWERFSDFAETQGYVAVMLPGNREYEADYLASGTTARGTSHMVVMNDGKLVHDPHPSNEGLVDVQCVWLLAKRASSTQGRQDEHAAFEASAKTYTSNVSFERDASDYVDMTASLLWHGWKLRASHGQAPAQPDNSAVHLSHCNMGEHVGSCKYGDDDCPALRKAPAQAAPPKPTPTPQADSQPAPAAVAGPSDTFRGDTTCLVQSIIALLELDAEGALVPHGIGGHARALLSAAASRLAAAPTTQPAPPQEPSHTAVQLAELVLSDCGHSSNYTPLLDRVAARIDSHVERRLDELRGCLESKPAPQQEAQEPVAWAEAEYFIDNPSAWSNFDQRASDAIAAVCKAFRAARAPADSVTAPAGGAVAGPTSDLHPEKCPITGRPFFMTLDHPELGRVPTYGGPYDSYTIPAPEGEPTDPWHERELRSERYDHDAGWWVEGGEPIPLRIVHEDVLFELQEDAEAAAAPTPLAQAADSVLEDAARWQMAALIGNEVMLHPDKRTNPAAVKAYMDAVHSGLDLTGAIDAARTNGDTP